MTILSSSVSQAEDGTWTFQCPGVQGDPCHGPDGVAFRSSEWPTKKSATARGAQHFASHKDQTPMQELHDFRVENGLVVADDGSVKVEDL